MMKVGARDLRTRAAEILRAVREGERVTITYRGEEIAEIRPLRKKRVSDAEAKKAMDDVFGMWADRDDMKDPSQWVHDLRRGRLDR